MAFHNVPPNGFPDIPDIEDLEAVEKDVKTLKTTTSEQGAAITALGTNKAPKTDISAAFSAESNYEVGDLVYYEGALYECTTAHEAAAWSAEDFTAASVGSTISGVNSNLTSLGTKVNGIQLNLRYIDLTDVTPGSAGEIDIETVTSGTVTHENLINIIPLGSNNTVLDVYTYNNNLYVRAHSRNDYDMPVTTDINMRLYYSVGA